MQSTLYMDDHLIKNVKNPVNKFDAVNTAYADRIKYKITTSIIPNIAMTGHILFHFPLRKLLLVEKYKYMKCGLKGWQMSG